MPLREEYDIAVVGAGHAGCEAALASAKLGMKTIVFTISIESIALMPCNPNIGGTSKGHLVRELDALGGEMARNIDKTFIQSRMLNESKGPAVHSLRVQADKQKYSEEMRKTLENTDNITIRQVEVSELILEETEGKKICRGVKTVSGAEYRTRAVILATGTYLKARCIYGEVSEETGPNGLKSSKYLSDSLEKAGIRLYRFKTGTPARVDKRSIDFSQMEEQKGDDPIIPFSFSTPRESIQKEQVSCYLTYTGDETHRIIRENIDRSPMYSGVIEGRGPRYCPSIEDKVMKFPDKERHQIFVEPEGLYTNEMYLAGMSSSLPEDVQHAMIKTLPGFEKASIVRNAYAIEYDCIDARQLYPSLEFKEIEGLFSGGQFNGSSGYEEAAVQGFMAGVNAAMKIRGREPFVLDRSQAYIGVLVDDLVTKESHEPYRMMTSRSEYRLLLRQDNADLRLSRTGFEMGMLSEERKKEIECKERIIEEEIQRLENTYVGSTRNVQEFLEKHSSARLSNGVSLAELIRRPELSYDLLEEIDSGRKELPVDYREQININIKYQGYIKRQEAQVRLFKKTENKKIPSDIDYHRVKSLRLEAVQKLSEVRPMNIGQASRISGVSPADISVLLVYIEGMKNRRRENV